MIGIETDRMKDWRIVSISTRTAQRLAIRYGLYPAAGQRRHRSEMQCDYIVRMIHRVHGLWFRRAKDLITNHLWQPCGLNATRSSRLMTFRRVLNCRPSNVFFRFGNAGRLRPCQQPRICPFCWSRLIAFLYRRFKRRISTARKTQDNLVLTCRVISYPVRIADFNNACGLEPEEMLTHARRLRDFLTQQRVQYTKLVKQLQRKTVGSCWRVVVDPQEDGWNIEVRQLFLIKQRVRPPLIKWRGSKTVFSKSVKVSDDEAMLPVIGEFMKYPTGMLTTYAELAAVYLQAGYNLRLASGTGVFRTCGNGLFRAFKKDKRHGEATTSRQAPAKGGDVVGAAKTAVPV